MNNTDIAAHMRLVDEYGRIKAMQQGHVSDRGFLDPSLSIELRAALEAVEASARQLSEQPGHLLIAAERWAQLEHMWSRNATPETIASYIGRPEILDRISKIRREHEAAVQGNAA